MNNQRSAHYSVNLSKQTGSLERLISRVRRRGFTVENMMVTQHGLNDGYRIELRLTGQRCFETLARHLANLIDVTAVSLQVSSTLLVYPVQHSGCVATA